MTVALRWENNALERLLCVLAALLLVAWCLREDVQPDLYFHLAAGRWMLEHGLPHTNVFLAPFPDHPFTNHEWLFQVFVWPLFQLGGARLLCLLKTLTVLATFALLLRACRRHGAIAAWVVIVTALMVAGGRFILRPEVFSFLGVSAHVYLLLRDRGLPRKSTLIALPLLQVIWSNTHGFSLLGPILIIGTLGATVAHWALERSGRFPSFSSRLGPAAGRRGVARLTALLGLEVLASCLNPYGLEAALYPYLVLARAGQDSASAGLSYRVVELLSPFSPGVRTVLQIRIYMVWLVAAPILYGIALWRGRARLEEGALGFILAATSVLYLRNLPFAAIGLAIPTAAGLGALAGLAREHLSTNAWTRARFVTAAVACLLAAGLTRAVLADAFHRNSSFDARPGLGLGDFPRYEEAVAFLERSPPRGALFNNFGAGHYLIYSRGHTKPFPYLCGNTDLYPRHQLARYHQLMRGELSLTDELDRLGVSDALLDHRVEVEDAVLRTLIAHPDWLVAHADAHAILFRRRTPDALPFDAAAFGRSVLEWEFPDERPDDYPPTRLLRAIGVLPDRQPQLLGRLQAAHLLELLGQTQLSKNLAEHAQKQLPSSPLVVQTLATIHEALGMRHNARRGYQRMTELMPHDPTPWVKLGLFALREGDTERAVSRLRHAVELDPASQLARVNLLSALEASRDSVDLRRELADTPWLGAAKRHYYLGAAAKLEGDLERAEVEFERALAANPRLSPAMALLAEVQGLRGDLAEAERSWEQLCELSPDDSSAWRALGQAQHRRDKPEAALASWTRAAKNPSEVEALVLATKLHQSRGQRDEAIKTLATALERNPAHPEAIRLRRKLISGGKSPN